MSERLCAELSARGLTSEVREESGEPVLVARGPDTSRGHLLLIGHMDTVLPAAEPRIEGGRLVATGAIDMKGGLAAFLGALDLLADRGVKPPDDLLLVVVLPEPGLLDVGMVALVERKPPPGEERFEIYFARLLVETGDPAVLTAHLQRPVAVFAAADSGKLDALPADLRRRLGGSTGAAVWLVDGTWARSGDRIATRRNDVRLVSTSGESVASLRPRTSVCKCTIARRIAASISAASPGALAITAGIFLPAFSFSLLFYDRLERVMEDRRLHHLLAGVAAGVVGLDAGRV